MRRSSLARSLSCGTRSVAILAASVAILLVAPGTVAQAPQVDSAATAQVRAELQALDQEMRTAIAHGDRAALERVFAPEFLYIHATGFEADRATHIDQELSADSGSRANLATPAPRRPTVRRDLYVSGDIAIMRVPMTLPSGRPMRSVFVFARQNGRWRYLQIQGTLLQPARTAVPVAPAMLDAYVGDYGDGPDGRPELSIRRQDGELIVRGVPVAFPRVLTPVGEARFFDKLGFEFIFARGADGRVTQVETRHEARTPARYQRRP